CVVGTSSEYCEELDDQIFTETFNCGEQQPEEGEDPFLPRPCVATTPVLGTDGNPIHSTGDGLKLYVACEET
ncbi:MAG: hypothetical protein ACF8TS_03275, partial [Maioricimonas sp. JB049]